MATRASSFMLGGIVAVVGLALLAYLAVLTLRGRSRRHAQEWDAYLAGLKDDERRRGPP